MSKLSEDLRSIAHELPNDRAEVLEQAADRIEELEQKSAEDSWRGSVDRMSGAFDQDELDAREQW